MKAGVEAHSKAGRGFDTQRRGYLLTGTCGVKKITPAGRNRKRSLGGI